MNGFLLTFMFSKKTCSPHALIIKLSLAFNSIFMVLKKFSKNKKTFLYVLEIFFFSY